MKLAIYDTGYGLSVGPDNESPHIHTLELVSCRIFKVQLPSSELSRNAWDREWAMQKQILREMVNAFNSLHKEDN